MDDEIVLELIEERSKGDFNPLHTGLAMGSPIVRQHLGKVIREPNAGLVGDSHELGPLVFNRNMYV